MDVWVVLSVLLDMKDDEKDKCSWAWWQTWKVSESTTMKTSISYASLPFLNAIFGCNH
jgi:hypothetical protein